jgi:hypothetical protein|tara:strand:+ start:4580 stop:5689 length:1110 start_codon:yes stop_codon:yes gene_type:complete
MQLFNLTKKIQAATFSLLLLTGVSETSPIGDVREVTGNTSILRDKESTDVSAGQSIELYDQAQTGKGRMLIEFLDKAELQLKEHSLVLIDEIYYDPDPALSKMSLKMVMGTARFASGRLGLVNKANIDIKTPTATIAVRGTDFTTTIDELGRSLIILLPDSDGNPSGEIIVTNEGGSVTLNEAYAATLVASTDTAPTQSTTIIGITPLLIDNMFIVNPPTEIRQRMEEDLRAEQNADSGLLDVDYLEFTELEDDALEDDFLADETSELDIDELDVEFLIDVLASTDSADLSDTLGEFNIKGARRGKNDESQYNMYLRDGNLVLSRAVNGSIEVQISAGGNFTLDTTTPTWSGIITGNESEDIVIVINQK